MGFFTDLGKGMASSFGDSLAGSLGGMAISGIGKLFGGMSAEEAAKKQLELEKEKMNYQAQLNKGMAEFNQGLAKDMWWYTSTNQVKALKEQGLNPALMYGKSGGGGGSAEGAGTAPGVSMGTTQAIGMGLQLEAQKAQIELTRAETAKAHAEAAKTAGVDTEVAGTEAEKNRADTLLKGSTKALQDAQKLLTDKKGALTDVDIKKAEESLKILGEEFKQAVVKTDIDQATKESLIETAHQEMLNTIYAGVQSIANIELTGLKKSYLMNQINGYWFSLQTERMKGSAAMKSAEAAGISAAANKANAETFSRRLTEEVKKWSKELSQKDTQILQDWIFKSVHSMTELTNAGANVIDSVIPF